MRGERLIVLTCDVLHNRDDDESVIGTHYSTCGAECGIGGDTVWLSISKCGHTERYAPAIYCHKKFHCVSLGGRGGTRPGAAQQNALV